MNEEGRVVAVSISDRRGVPKENVAQGLLIADYGIEGDAHAGDHVRQVSLLAVESIGKMRAGGVDVSPGAFAENITTAGIDLLALAIGDRLRVGVAELEIAQIGKECHSRCAIYERAGDCVMPREGVFARVVRGGRVKCGDAVRVISEQ
jgi:MOSC domain-containing protein YiiM